MDITNDNFLSTLPEICETIRACDYIAIDTELSGLMRERVQNRLDVPEERFLKALRSSRGYFIMQFGLSCFTKLDESRYTNRTYNFYIFPQPHKIYGDIDRTMSIQAHAIQFLIEHNFDFNKLFRHGVSYMTFEEKKALTSQLKLDAKNRSTAKFNKDGTPQFIPPQMMSFCRDSIKRVREFAAQAAQEQKRASGFAVETDRCHIIACPNSKTIDDDEMIADEIGGDRSTSDKPASKVGPQLVIRDCGTHKRRNTLKNAIECLPIAENLFIDTKHDRDTSETYLVLEYMERETKSERLKDALARAKGFLEILNQFIEPLEDDYNSFKETCHSLFPLIYDTKYIAHNILDPQTLTQNQSRLNDLYCQLKLGESFPKVQIEHVGVIFDDNQLPHQAGYDAYMSGFCFLVMCKAFLGEKKEVGQSIVQLGEIVSQFANKIHLSFSDDFKYFNLTGEEEREK